MPIFKLTLAAAAAFVAAGCVTANATPLTYTVAFTENDQNGYSSVGTATFTIDSSQFGAGQMHYSLPSDITNFSATFYNVGGPGITDSFGEADLTAIDIETDTANSPPFDWVFFDTADNAVFVNDPCCSFTNGNDYMAGLAGELPQTIQNDQTGLAIYYRETIAPVPEPASLALVSLGAVSLAMTRRRRRS